MGSGGFWFSYLSPDREKPVHNIWAVLVCLKFSCSRILLVARRNFYFSTMGEESGTEFDFDKWSEDHNLNRKTTGILRGQDLDKLPALMLIEPEDLLPLGLTTGQRRLSLSAVKKLQEEHKEHDVPTALQDDNGADHPPEDGQDDPVVRMMTDGKTFDQLHVFDEPPFEGATGKPAGHITHFDPRHILTTKAHTTKALHITQFLSEKTKKRRLSRRKELVLTAKGDHADHLVLKTEDDHPYSGIYLDEWGAANCRLMNHLLQSNILKREDIEYYLSYMTQIYEFASKYEWDSVLDYDHCYRELQAEHQFMWGVFSSHLELHVLIPKRRNPTGNGHNQRPSASQNATQECRMYKATGACTFGPSCRYRHVRVYQQGSPQQGTVTQQGPMGNRRPQSFDMPPKNM